MQVIDLSDLSKQFAGRKLGELVLQYAPPQSSKFVIEALQGTINKLPSEAKTSVESWIDEISPMGKNPSFWKRDCGEAFLFICTRGRERLASLKIKDTEDDIFHMFQIIVLNFAYGCHKHPQSKAFIQKSIGIGFFRRLFS